MSKFSLLLLMVILFSCSGEISSEGKIENKTIDIKPFSHLKLKGKFNIFYIESDKNFIDVETYPNVYENLNIENEGDTLIISEKKPTKKVDFYQLSLYTNRQMESITMSDSVQMNTNSLIKIKNIQLNLYDYAKFIGDISAEKATVKMANLSLMNVKGNVKKMNLSLMDTANFLSPYFIIATLDLKAKNQTYSEINVKDTITGDVKNMSKVLYYNNPVRDFKIGDSAIVNHQKLN